MLFDQFAHEGDSLVGAEPLRELKTGVKGDFSFSVKTGVYRLEVVPASATRILGHSLSEIKVTTNTNLNISLATGSIVSGRINTLSSSKSNHNSILTIEMLTGTEVVVLGIEPSSYKAVSQVAEDGSFSLVVPRGKYHIALRCAQRELDEREALPSSKFKLVSTHSDVITISNDVDLTLEWPELFLFEGEVVDHLGQPVACALVTVGPAASRRSLLLSELSFDAKTISDASGRFQLSLESGAYDIVVEPPDSLLFGCIERDLQVIEGCHHRFVLAQGHRLKGQVVFDDHLLSQSLVRVQSLDGQKREYIARTDSDGQFAITVPDGSYKLIVQAHPKDSPPVTIDGAEYTALAPWTRNIVVGGDTHVAIRLALGTALRGRICDDSGQARTSVKVSVFAAHTGQTQFLPEGRSSLAYGITDGEGCYCLFLAPGQFWLVVHQDFANAKLIEIATEPVTEDIIWHGWSQIRFEVIGEDNQVIPRCQVFYQPYGSDFDFALEESLANKGALPLPHGYVLTGEQGSCLLTLPSGVYTFRFTPPEAGSFQEKTIRQLSISADLSRRVTLELKSSQPLSK
ncbi:carboxypeptidase regulatory-like domain-containing protein [bacterium]|nr:carboxypeptidase regulatory-like domain-containing protein [bacterium]MBP9809249.1 carboxypeptidase regulatory-like domain-containing protein [bacterium]